MSQETSVSQELNQVAAKVATKMDQAKAIFAESAGVARKDVIARFIKEVGLTKAGASTYYQKLHAAAKVPLVS